MMLYDTGSPKVYPVLYSANEFLTGTTTPYSAGWAKTPKQLGFGIEICSQAITPGIVAPYTIDPYVAGTYTSWARSQGCGEVYVWVMDCTSPPNLYAKPPENVGIPTDSIAISLYQMFIQEIINAMYMPPPAPGNYPVVPIDTENPQNSVFYLYTMSSPPDKAILNPTTARPPSYTGLYRNGQMLTDGRYGMTGKNKNKPMKCPPCSSAASKPRRLGDAPQPGPAPGPGSSPDKKKLSAWAILAISLGIVALGFLIGWTATSK
jgi:hypothetical protein